MLYWWLRFKVFYIVFMIRIINASFLLKTVIMI